MKAEEIKQLIIDALNKEYINGEEGNISNEDTPTCHDADIYFMTNFEIKNGELIKKPNGKQSS